MESETGYIAQQIRNLRVAKNMKQAELDDLAGLPKSTISKIELGKREATASELVRISQALGATLDMLVSGDDSFVYREEIKVIEALREVPFDDYQRILRTLEAQVYFTAKDAKAPLKQHLLELVTSLTNLSQVDRRPRNNLAGVRRIKISRNHK